MKTISNSKRIIIGLVVCLVAIGSSAFTVASSKRIPGDILGNTGPTSYSKLSQPYNPALCQDAPTSACAYRVTDEGGPNVPDSFPAANISTYLANGWIEQVDSHTGQYLGL